MAISKLSHPVKAGTYITYSEIAPAAQVVKRISSDCGVVNYAVKIDNGSGMMKSAILRIFDANSGAGRFRDVCKELNELVVTPLKGYIPEYSTFCGPDGTCCILLQADYNNQLNVQQDCGGSFQENISFYCNLAEVLSDFEKNNVSLSLNPKYIVRNSESNLQWWKLDEATETDHREISKKNMEYLAKQFYQSITGLVPKAADIKAVPFDQSDFANYVTQALCAELTVQDLDGLLSIFQRCLHDSVRYSDFGELSGELRQLSEQININRRFPKAVQDRDFAAADFLYRNPLYHYVHTTENGNKELNVVMVGSCSMRDPFFKMLFSSAQMLDTQLRIHIVSATAEDYYEQLAENAPLLTSVATISRRGFKKNSDTPALNEDIVQKDKPFAELIFEQYRGEVTAEKLLQYNPGCVLLMRRYNAKTRKLVKDLVNQSQQPVLLGVGTSKNIERNNFGPNHNVNVRIFSRRGACVAADSKEQTEIYKKALALHTYYAKGNNERVSMGQVYSDFQTEYSQASSIRSVLTIPYKLAACGLDMHNVSERFYDMVLSPKRDQKLRQRLLWLEHRSWQAFIVINGGQLLTLEELKERVERGEYNHRILDKNNWPTKHACLYSSIDNPDGLLLAQQTPSVWDRDDLNGLDKLDALSVYFHQLLATKANEEKKNAEKLLKAVQEALGESQSALYAEVSHWLQQLQNHVPHANLGWKRTCDQLKSVLPDHQDVEKLEQLARLIVLSTEKRDFKESDLSVMESIPYLMLEKPIQTVYKLCADKPWFNIASSVAIEQENLVILSDSEHSVDEEQLEHLNKFLQDKRHLNCCVTQMTLSALTQVASNAVLDVTGVTAHQILDALQHEALRTLPVVEWRNGELLNPDRSCPHARFYAKKRSLTVEETLALTGTKTSEQFDNLLLSAGKDSEVLWKVVQHINGDGKWQHYNGFASLLANAMISELALYQNTGKPFYLSMKKETAEDCGMLGLLNQLEKARLIKKIPKWNDDKMPIEAARRDHQDFIHKILAYAERQSASGLKHPERYKLRRSATPGGTYFFHDQGLQCVLNIKCYYEEKWKSHCVDMGHNKMPLRNLQQIIDLLNKNQFIEPLKGQDILTHDRRKELVTVKFSFKDAAKRALLIKEGNVLEAYAYHTIRRANLFDDVKLGVNVVWADHAGATEETSNEIDLICTKGVKSYFISCKKCYKLHKEHLTEIRYEADRFGVDGVAILLTTARKADNEVQYARAKRMDIKVITLQDFERVPNNPEDSGAKLISALKDLLPRDTNISC